MKRLAGSLLLVLAGFLLGLAVRAVAPPTPCSMIAGVWNHAGCAGPVLSRGGIP